MSGMTKVSLVTATGACSGSNTVYSVITFPLRSADFDQENSLGTMMVWICCAMVFSCSVEHIWSQRLPRKVTTPVLKLLWSMQYITGNSAEAVQCLRYMYHNHSMVFNREFTPVSLFWHNNLFSAAFWSSFYIWTTEMYSPATFLLIATLGLRYSPAHPC